jgi:chemotaxis protein methyltransferase CheR
VRVSPPKTSLRYAPDEPLAQQCDDWLTARACLDEKCFSEAEKCIACVLRDDPRNQDALLIQGDCPRAAWIFSDGRKRAEDPRAG